MSEIITKQSERVTRFLSTVDRMTEALDKLSDGYAPRFGGEHYVNVIKLSYKSLTTLWSHENDDKLYKAEEAYCC